jgi:hypothetical protein
MVMHKISPKHILAASLICLSAVAPASLAQSGTLDSEAKNYKLSMEKIKAYDSARIKMQTAMASDPAMQNSLQDAIKKGGMMTAIENNPKLMAIFKSSGISAHEFLIVPSCVQITASVYNSQAQGSVMGAAVSQENIAFYVKNKAEIDRIVQTWGRGSGGK